MQKKWIITIILICAFVAAIILSLSAHREAIDEPHSYTFGVIAPLTTLSNPLNLTFDNATAQYIALGEKPLLHIENMDTTLCLGAQAHLLMQAQDMPTQRPEDVMIGNVRFPTGNTNYEIPFDINRTLYPIVQIWCNATGSFVARADFRQNR